MKTLKFMSLCLVFVLIGIQNSFAQAQQVSLTEEQKEELKANLEDYFEALDLTEEQKTEFETITRKYALEMKAVKDGGGSRLQKYNQVKSIRKNKNAETKELLSEEQYEMYLEKQKEMQKKMKENRKNN